MQICPDAGKNSLALGNAFKKLKHDPIRSVLFHTVDFSTCNELRMLTPDVFLIMSQLTKPLIVGLCQDMDNCDDVPNASRYMWQLKCYHGTVNWKLNSFLIVRITSRETQTQSNMG